MADRPNIVIVITHDSGRQFGCYGAGVETPNVDRIASEGVRFDRAFCTAPQCSPARASIITGLYPQRHGMIGLLNRGFLLDAGVPALPRLLGEVGYHTALFGFQHEARDAHETGYRRVVRSDTNNAADVLPKVESFFASQPAEPFFINIGFSETHRPIRHGVMDDPDKVKVPAWLPEGDEVRMDLANFHGDIRAVDEAVGRVEAAIAQAGLRDNTLIIYTTDHGIPFPNAKATLHDAGLGVALVARGPGGFAGGKVIDRLVSTMDLMPTLAELGGAQVPDGLDGRSLLPLLADADSPWREDIFAEQTYHAGYDPMRSVRTDRWKYIRSFEPRPICFGPNVDRSPSRDVALRAGLMHQPRAQEQLFDLQADPDELHNLADDPAAAGPLADMRARVGAWMEQVGDRLLDGPVPQPEGTVVTPAGALEPEQMDAPDQWQPAEQ